MKLDLPTPSLPKLKTKNVTPILALGALAIIAFASLIEHGRSVDPAATEAKPEMQRLSFNGRLHAEREGQIAVGETDAPAVDMVHSGMALVDRARFPKGLAAAHATLPLGSWARLSNLSTGRNVAAKIVSRPDPDSPYIVVLSADLATGLGVDPSVVDLPVLVEPLQRSPRDSRVLASSSVYDPNEIATASISGARAGEMESIANADRYLEFGLFEQKSEAVSLLKRLKDAKLTNGRFGDAVVEPSEAAVGAWRVRLGPVAGWEKAIEAQRAVEQAGLPEHEVVRR